jgi:hypothetical protein
MKKQVITVALLAISTFINAQSFNPAGSPPNAPIYRDGQTGFGMFVPPTVYMVEVESQLPDDGISITQLQNGSSCLHLNNLAPGGQNYFVGSTSASSSQGAGHFVIFDNTTSNDRFMIHQNGNVGIGTISPLINKLEVIADTTNQRAGYFEMNGQTLGIGPHPTALKGFVKVQSSIGRTIGVDGESWHPNSSCCDTAIGVKGLARGASVNYGGYFAATDSAFSTNYGVYAMANNASTSWAGFFQGDVNINGLAYCTSSAWSSDKRFKKNITILPSMTAQIMKVKGYTYDYKTEEFPSKNFVKGQQVGFIAQELKEIFPQLVTEDKEGYNYVNYLGMIPVLLEGFKEQVNMVSQQSKENQALKDEVADLKKQLIDQQQQISDVLKKMESQTTGFNTPTKEANEFSMSQNEPNPFNGETRINYVIPANATNSYLAVYDLSGKQIKTIPITEKGQSFITVSSEKLAAGIYIYSVVADGKIVDSKRMIVAEK